MLSDLEVYATIPARDINRARKFYTEKLGFTLESETPAGITFRSKNSRFMVYPTLVAGTAQHTLAGWQTGHLEQDVKDLRSRGIVFEEYDLPGLKTVNGIGTTGTSRAAWFKDSEGNVLGIFQMG